MRKLTLEPMLSCTVAISVVASGTTFAQAGGNGQGGIGAGNASRHRNGWNDASRRPRHEPAGYDAEKCHEKNGPTRNRYALDVAQRR